MACGGAAGNVRDLCLNPWTKSGSLPEDGYLRPQRAPKDAEDLAVRGGSWSSMPAFCRPANRFAGRPEDALSPLGFRVVRVLS